jgi:hypothetical protein
VSIKTSTNGHMLMGCSIISQVLNWDIKDLDSRASKIEGDKEGLSKEQIACLKEYVNSSAEEQAKIRDQSRK